jgi:hypothetical protein
LVENKDLIHLLKSIRKIRKYKKTRRTTALFGTAIVLLLSVVFDHGSTTVRGLFGVVREIPEAARRIPEGGAKNVAANVAVKTRIACRKLIFLMLLFALQYKGSTGVRGDFAQVSRKYRALPRKYRAPPRICVWTHFPLFFVLYHSLRLTLKHNVLAPVVNKTKKR